MGRQAGVITLMGAADAEDVDVIVRGGGPFTAVPRKIGDAYDQVVVQASRQLTSADEGMHDIVVTINGRALPTRTAEAYARIQVTASNALPVLSGLTDDKLILSVPESDKTASETAMTTTNGLITAMTTGTTPTETLVAGGDLSAYVSDDNTLTYSVDDATAFNFKAGTSLLTPSGDLAVMGEKAATGKIDDPSTADIDESKTIYEAPSGGKFSNGLAKTNVAFDNVKYEFKVIVRDAANTVEIPVELTVVPNKPVSAVADASGAEGYESTNPFGHVIVDLADYVTDPEGGVLTYVDVIDPAVAPFQLEDATGEVKVTFPGRVTGANVWTLTVTVEDGFENTFGEVLNDDGTSQDPKKYEDVVDQTVTITITAMEGTPPQRIPHSISVDEHTAVDTVVGSVATLIDNVIEYEEVAGSTGSAHFEVVETGADKGDIIIMSDLDADAADAVTTMLLSVKAFGDNNIELGEISVLITIRAINEAPKFVTTDDYARSIDENAQTGATVGAVVVATDADAGADGEITYSVSNKKDVPFDVITTDDGTGQIVVDEDSKRQINILNGPYTVKVKATDGGGESATQDVVVGIGDINDPPKFDNDAGENSPTLHKTIAENSPGGTPVATYNATDKDGPDVIEGVKYVLRNADDTGNFNIEDESYDDIDGVTHIRGVLTVADGAKLEYDIEQDSPAPVTYTVEVNVCDAEEACSEIALVVTLENSDDEAPVIGNDDDSQDVPENSARGTSLGDYSATDKDNLNDPGFDVTKYSLRGTHAKVFNISDTGELMTLAALDYDRINANGTRGVPCVSCEVTVVATDSDGTEDTQPVTISVLPVEDSVSTLDVTKANPVPGTEMGKATSALAGTKIGSNEYLWNMLDCYEMKALVNSDDDSTYCKMWDGLSAKAQGVVSGALGKDAEERPGDLPVTYGSAPMNFVETEWANWGSVLRIAVTSESPDATCDNGNQCVVVNINSDSADDSLKLKAYRSGDQENEYVAAVMLVEESKHVTSSDAPVYMHGDALYDDDPNPNVLAPRLKVDEEDEIEVEFGNLRGSIDVENEAPEISNFAPEHEAAFDDADVDYTFTVTDSHSGLPEPEDLPDVDGDENYTPVVALISESQCVTHDSTVVVDSKVLKVAARIHEDETLYCRGIESDGEYIATEASSDFGFAPIRDDKDFDEIDDGFEVETTIVLAENKTFYVTFIACDNAGNCTFYDPDGNDDAEELAQITVDTEEPEFVEARTGLTWDSTDNEYDDNRSFIQVIFNDLTQLNVATVEIEDFVVEGHTIKDVHIFENPDDDDVDWADSPRYGAAGSNNLRDIARYRDIENSVFVELEDELLADETPDVTIVPNGVEDKAGNEQDGGDHEADDWISPKFTIVSLVSTRETSQDEVLAGDDDEVTVVVTADERLDSTRPTVTVTYVNATMIDTKGTAKCDDKGNNDGTRERGEIVNNGKCADNGAATGGVLNNSVEKVSNTEWIVTITEPKDTGYYNFHIEGDDRSPQENPGSEGVSPGAIVTDFFDADGDVNVDDAVFFEGDINLPKPQVRVSGFIVEGNEADVEFRSPLFVELNFAMDHSDNCSTTDNDVLMANCTNENSEYAEDNFDDVVVTSFVLDGVDITDSVKTTDNQSFLVSLESISIGDHTATVQAVDQAGNVFEDTLEIDFEVNDRDPFTKRLSPGWNLVSLPGEPANSSIASVFGPGVEVRTVYSYDPVIPGGWQVAVRETLDSDWQGDLTEINGQHGYWVLSDAIQDWEVSIPRLAGGAAGTGTPIQPPVIPLYAGWNLIPVTDVKGNALDAGITVSAVTYLQSLDEGVVPARVLGFNTIRNEWYTILDGDMTGPGMGINLEIGSGYWVFVREAISLVPGGAAGGASGD